MTDPALVEKRLARITSAVSDLRRLARLERLREDGLAEQLSRMAGFRNVLVHGYDDVDVGVVEDIVRHHLDDFQFAAVVGQRF